jgi:regulator of sigma E protease
MTQIIAVVFGLSFLVIVHELGHYLVARAYGMRVLRFSIGLGPPIAKWQPKGSPTVFQVAAIPFLAYVQIDGMNPFEEIDKTDPALFPNKSATARFATLFAGSAFNYIAASILVFIMVAIGGLERENVVVVGHVEAGLPGAEAGLREGDIIERIDGSAVTSFNQVVEAARAHVDQPIVFGVLRGTDRLDLTITPRMAPTPSPSTCGGSSSPSTRLQPRIGVAAGAIYDSVSLGRAAATAVVFPAAFVVVQIRGLIQQIRNPDPDGLSSVVDMGAMMAETVERGWRDYLSLIAGISIALAVFNLLPIPALDGGRIMFVLYEAITRRRPNEKFEAVVHTAGLLLLLGLVLIVNARSVYRLWFAPTPAPATTSAPATSAPATAPAATTEPAPAPAPPPSEVIEPAPTEVPAPAEGAPVEATP